MVAKKKIKLKGNINVFKTKLLLGIKLKGKRNKNIGY